MVSGLLKPASLFQRLAQRFRLRARAETADTGAVPGLPVALGFDDVAIIASRDFRRANLIFDRLLRRTGADLYRPRFPALSSGGALGVGSLLYYAAALSTPAPAPALLARQLRIFLLPSASGGISVFLVAVASLRLG